MSAALPADAAPEAAAAEALLEVEHVKQYFPIRPSVLNTVQGHVHAVDDVSFSLRE